MTIDSKTVIRDVILGEGFYGEDRQVFAIYSYINRTTMCASQAVFYHIEHVDVYESPFVLFPILLWSASTGLTKEGQDWLNELKKEEECPKE